MPRLHCKRPADTDPLLLAYGRVRVIAMHHGVVQHIGTPLEIYDRPANIFVASFIGSPAMNLISATQKRAGSGSAINLAGTDFTLPAPLSLEDGTDSDGIVLRTDGAPAGDGRRHR